MEALIAELDEEKVLLDNQRLQSEITQLSSRCKSLETSLSGLQEENLHLRTALSEEILNEKLDILKISKRKMELYFRNETANSENRLTHLEYDLQNSIRQNARQLESKWLQDQDDLKNDLEDLRSRIEAVKELRLKELADQKQQSWQEIEDKFRLLQSEGVSNEVVARRMRQNNLEINLGLGWLNRLGILLILLGIGTVIQYSYSHWFTAHIKGNFMFVLGLAFLGGGEYLNRRQKSLFSLGLTAGGSAILYFAFFSSYFYLHIMSLPLATLLAVLITALTIAMSLRYDSKAICIYALVGGYLPFSSYVFLMDLNASAIYIAMSYVFLLNAMVLFISLFKKWQAVNYIAFTINIPVLIYLISSCSNPFISLVFTAAVFMLYLLIIISYSLRQAVPLNVYDIILLGINTTISCITAYWIFGTAGWNDYRGLLAAGLALFYYLLGRIVEKQVQQGLPAQALFYLTALTFSVLMIPFQFGITWISMGWTIEALCMIIFGIKNRVRLLEGFGWVVLGATWLAFFQVDYAYRYMEHLFYYKYTLIVAAMFTSILYYLKNHTRSLIYKISGLPTFFKIVKYFVLLNVLVYLNDIFSYFYSNHLIILLNIPSGFTSYYSSVFHSLIIAFFIIFIARNKLIGDKTVSYAALVLTAYVDLKCLWLTLEYPLFSSPASSLVSFIALAVLIIYHVIVLFSIKWAVLQIISKLRYNLELYPLTVGLYSILALSLVLGMQLNWLPYSSFVVSAGNMLLAMVFVMFGMRRGFVYIRRVGLLLAVAVSAKLFIVDLSYLEILGKIIAYFSFGLVLLIISYLYQRMEKAYDSVIGVPIKPDQEGLNNE